MTLTKLRQKLTEVTKQTQTTDTATVNALVRSGIIGRHETVTFKAAVSNLKRVGSIRKLIPKHAEIIQRVYSMALAGSTGSSTAINAIHHNLTNSFEPTNSEFISETPISHDPPPMIVLKRKGVRSFPDGKKVALYTNDNLNLSFTIPYTNSTLGMPVAAMQEAVVDKPKYPVLKFTGNNFEHVKKILNTGIESKVKFRNGGSAVIDRTDASMIHNLHTNLNDENKKKLEQLISKSAGHLDSVLAFAKKHKQKKPKNA